MRAVVQRSLLQPGQPAAQLVKPAILGKGFRPFFLLAGLQAALAMPLWLAMLGGAKAPPAYFGGPFWHAHEMIFGFALAVIAGFLLTAIGNWTSRETATGGLLAALAALWLVGRLAVFFADQLPRPLPAVLDLAFLPALAVVCARPMVATQNKRNYQFVAMLALLFAGNLGMHLGALGVWAEGARKGAWLAVYVVIAMIVVMTARVVPMFTRNATGQKAIRNLPKLDVAAIVGVVLSALADLATLDERLVAALCAATGLMVLARMAPWGTLHTFGNSLLWILHAGHAFVGLGFLLRGAVWLTPALPATAALHAFTAGAIGCLTLGMMARVSLGHSGRMLAVKPIVGVAFGAVVLAALLRVFGPLGGNVAYRHSMNTAGGLFAFGFLVFVVIFAPILLAPRVDGKPG